MVADRIVVSLRTSTKRRTNRVFIHQPEYHFFDSDSSFTPIPRMECVMIPLTTTKSIYWLVGETALTIMCPQLTPAGPPPNVNFVTREKRNKSGPYTAMKEKSVPKMLTARPASLKTKTSQAEEEFKVLRSRKNSRRRCVHTLQVCSLC